MANIQLFYLASKEYPGGYTQTCPCCSDSQFLTFLHEENGIFNKIDLNMISEV